MQNMSEPDFRSRLHLILDEYDDFSESDFTDGNILGETYGQTLVGHGQQTKGCCGHIRKTKVCLNVDLHNRLTLDGKSYIGKVKYKKVHFWCHKPECPVCYGAWATRESYKMEGRLNEVSRHFGQAEHLVISVPKHLYHLSVKALRRKAVKILEGLGVIGGSVITHAFRFRPDHWYIGVHFHALGFVLGGLGRCRHCQKRLARSCPDSCDGFLVRAWKEHLKSGWYITVAHDRYGNIAERKSVRGTAKYELSHASFEKGSKRANIVLWFGVCSYRKLKWTPEKKKEVCEICGYELKHGCYVGSERFDVFADEGWTNFLDIDGHPQFVLIGEG